MWATQFTRTIRPVQPDSPLSVSRILGGFPTVVLDEEQPGSLCSDEDQVARDPPSLVE